MYCHKCGQELPDQALFCPSCGTKVTYGEPASQDAAPVTPIPPGSAAPSSKQFFPENPSSTIPAPAVNPSAGTPKPEPKKKAKRGILIGGLSAAGVVLVAVVLFVVLNWKSVDYVASVQAFQPFYHSQGLPYTYGEVLDEYLPDAEWSAVKEGKGIATVEVSGTAKGLEEEVKLSVQMAPNPEDPNGSLYTLESVSLGDATFSDQGEAVEILYRLFLAYDRQVEDLSQVLPETEVELSQTFTDEAAGITFQYPENWVSVETDSEYTVISLIDSENDENSVANLMIQLSLDQNPFGIFTDEESAVEQAVNEFHTYVSMEDTTLGSVPAVELIYQTPGLKGTDRVINYWYQRGEDVYQVICSFSELTSMKYAPIFEAILDSYQVAPAPEPTPTPIPAPTPTPAPTPSPTDVAMDAYRNILSQASSYDFSGGYGDPNPPDATYTYALASVCPGSDIPGLLLSCTNPTFGMDYIRVFQYDAASGTVWQPETTLTTGTASAGGFRGGLAPMADGNGLYYSYAYAMTGEAYVDRVTIEDGVLYQTSEWSGMIGDGGAGYLQSGEILWYDVNDGSGL